jgi:hypothetical protein
MARLCVAAGAKATHGSFMRDMQRLLTYSSLIGSVIYGWQHNIAWLVVPVAAFGIYALLEDRQIRLQIGTRHWPSEGFARFQMGSNLFLMLWNAILNAIIFAIAAMMSSALGG